MSSWSPRRLSAFLSTAMYSSRTRFILIATLVLSGCSESLGPDAGSAEAFVHDDPPPGSTFAGTAAGDFYASISTDGETWLDLGSPNGITVELQSASATTVHGAQSVPHSTYRWVRLSFRDVQIKVAAGSTIGGTTFDGEQTVELAANEEISAPIQVGAFEIDDASGAVISFDLNSDEWLTLDRVLAGAIAGAVVVDHLTVTVR